MLRTLIPILAAVAITGAAAGPAAASARLADEAGRSLLRTTAASWDSGDRVLVTSPAPYRVGLPGWFDSMESDSVLRVRFSRSADPVAVRISQIGTLSERVGSRRHPRRGALVGLWVGALLEAAIEDDPDAFINGPNRPYIPLGAVAGIVVGTTVGSAKATDVWREVARFD
ncbi:MAG TPA: hypothetical protein VLT84_07180 [Acidobacteriota bacterium]|nr:hypothetical protein [Acidobacteriota bacterium]